jgi:hypothetical protein
VALLLNVGVFKNTFANFPDVDGEGDEKLPIGVNNEALHFDDDTSEVDGEMEVEEEDAPAPSESSANLSRE